MKHIRSITAKISILFSLLFSLAAHAQGTLPLALTQQFSFTNCATFTNQCGTPLIGGLLYFYTAGSNSAVQNSYQDQGLTIAQSWPLVLDSNGRVPMFFLASGTVHVRLTDANGVVQFDYPQMLVIGPSGSGGGGSSVDPTTVASTGDIKFRATGETLSGWVKLNGQTIGNATSGASQFASATAQALFVYLWTNCPIAHCPVVGGAGASALSDFNAGKQITLPDLRGRTLFGLDDMGNTAAGRLLPSQITSGGADTVTTPNATGGSSTTTLTVAQLPAAPPVGTISGSQTITGLDTGGPVVIYQGSGAGSGVPSSFSDTRTINGSNFTMGNLGSGQAANTISPMMLGSWYIKL